MTLINNQMFSWSYIIMNKLPQILFNSTPAQSYIMSHRGLHCCGRVAFNAKYCSFEVHNPLFFKLKLNNWEWMFYHSSVNYSSTLHSKRSKFDENRADPWFSRPVTLELLTTSHLVGNVVRASHKHHMKLMTGRNDVASKKWKIFLFIFYQFIFQTIDQQKNIYSWHLKKDPKNALSRSRQNSRFIYRFGYTEHRL